MLPQEIDRCLYLDIDMLVLQPLEELFALDLGENIAAVVLDCSNPYQEKRLKARDSTQADFVFPFRKEYFNSGFMLINLKKWRESQVESRALEFMRTFITRVGDQDILNAVIGKETLKLSGISLSIISTQRDWEGRITSVLMRAKTASMAIQASNIKNL